MPDITEQATKGLLLRPRDGSLLYIQPTLALSMLKIIWIWFGLGTGLFL